MLYEYDVVTKFFNFFWNVPKILKQTFKKINWDSPNLFFV